MRDRKNVLRLLSNDKGITLLALVVTIIVLLILGALTISVSLRGELFDFAKKAKQSTAESANIENIDNAYTIAKSKSRTGKVTLGNLQEALDEVLGENVGEAVDNEDAFAVKVGDIIYVLDKTGNISEGKKLVPLENAGDITKNGTCTGTYSKPYRIECIEDLVNLAKEVNTDNTTNTKFGGKYILLVNDLDFNSVFSYSNYKAKYSYVEADHAYEPDENSDKTIKELCTTGQGFIPIGNNCPRFFGGIFYGNKPNGERTKIKNIYIHRSDNAGLFDNCSGANENATINNIEIDGKITCTGSGTAAGFVCGVLSDKGININNCVNRATIKNTGTGKAVGICAKLTSRTEADQ